MTTSNRGRRIEIVIEVAKVVTSSQFALDSLRRDVDATTSNQDLRFQQEVLRGRHQELQRRLQGEDRGRRRGQRVKT